MLHCSFPFPSSFMYPLDAPFRGTIFIAAAPRKVFREVSAVLSGVHRSMHVLVVVDKALLINLHDTFACRTPSIQLYIHKAQNSGEGVPG